MHSPPAIAVGFSADPSPLCCDNVDLAKVRLLSRVLLHTLAAACVERTYADPFKSAISVAATVKAEMVSFLSLSRPEITSPPVEMAQDLLDQFVHSKTSFLSRVSSTLMNSETKEDRIEDLVEEMELAGTWASSEREQFAIAIFRKLDIRKSTVCSMAFEKEEELIEHQSMCPFRPTPCGNEGCGHVFSALYVLDHDASCPFKLLRCEQDCDDVLKRSEMDKHCITVCPMKPVKCPFHSAGCVDFVPQRNLEQHCEESVASHLAYSLQAMQKQEALVSNLTQRVLLLEKALSINERSEAVEVGTLSLSVHHQEAKIKALEQETQKLRKDLKKASTSAEVVQLRRELQALKTKPPA